MIRIIWFGMATILVVLSSAGYSDAQEPSKSLGVKSVEANSPGSSASPARFGGSMRIVKLLWNSQPEAASIALRRAIEVALDRNQLSGLKEQLASLEDIFQDASKQPANPCHAVAVAALALAKPTEEHARALSALAQRHDDEARREFLLRVWLNLDEHQAFQYVARELESVAAGESQWQQRVLSQAFGCNRDTAAKLVLRGWNRLSHPVRLAAIEPLSQKVDSMRELVAAVEAGVVPKDIVNTNQLRKWLVSGDKPLTEKIGSIWGQVRESDDQQRQTLVRQTIDRLKSPQAHGNPENGWSVFQRVCSQCHVLHGRGFEVGPNISANGRGNFEQLISNVLDPSLVIGPAFQARLVVTKDGQVLTGILVAEDEKRLTLKLQGGKSLELDKQSEIEQLRISSKSLMPEGLEQQLTEQEMTDLFALLCLTKAPGVPDNEAITGTPPQLIGIQK